MNPLFTIGKRRNFGVSATRMPSNGKVWLAFVFWFPRRWNKELGYRYASIRWL